MTKKEMIELYCDILGEWKDNIEDQRKKCGGSADEPMYVDASFVTSMLKDFIDSLANMEDEKVSAIEFLKHARDMCKNGECEKCPVKAKQDECGMCYRMLNMTDNDIADLVREIERWWRENG